MLIERVLKHKEDIIRIAESNPDVVCIAMANDKLLVGVPIGREGFVVSFLEKEFEAIGIEFAVGWEVTVSKYPVAVVKHGRWCLG